MASAGDIRNARFTHLSHGAVSYEVASEEEIEVAVRDDDGKPVLNKDKTVKVEAQTDVVWTPYALSIDDGKVFSDFVKKNKADIQPMVVFEEIANAEYLNADKTRIKFERKLAGEKALLPSSLIKKPDDGTLKTRLANALFDRVVKEAGKVADYVPPVYDAAAAKEAAKMQSIEYIDQLREQLTGRFTKAEQDGWIKTLDEAHALIADQNAAAPGVRLQAKIEGIDALDLAKGIVAASGITSMIPNLAAGFRSKANSLIEATDGSQEQLAKVFEQLRGLGEAIASAVATRDQNALQKALGAF